MEKNWREPAHASKLAGLKLLIVHSHYRPGGVRRVIELAAPHVASALQPAANEIVLVGGEAPDEAWRAALQQRVGAVPVSVAVDPALAYCSEQHAPAASIARRVRAHLERCLAAVGDDQAVVWAHNQGLGRNLFVAAALPDVCAARRVPLVFHHHDWWFDNRWARWPEMREGGFRTVEGVAEAILPVSAGVHHAAINHADAARLQRYFGPKAGWIPNLMTPEPAPSAVRTRRARAWLRERLGDDAPVWLLPCRLLRRKNFAEALLLTRWLRPGAWLVTTGGVSSADEHAYAAALQQAAQRQGWRLRLSVLAGAETNKPSVRELLAASEAVLLTSLQEGFGLPNLEAAAAQRPLITRTLPNIAPDLARFGFTFPQTYREIAVATDLFDWKAERQRQVERFRAWKAGLPDGCRKLAATPPLLAARARPEAVPFSRLTLTAQLEILGVPGAVSWETCAPLNPFLEEWRALATDGQLAAPRWPRSAGKWLSGAAYAARFRSLLAAGSAREPAADAGARASRDFIRATLSAENQYPLLWTSAP